MFIGWKGENGPSFLPSFFPSSKVDILSSFFISYLTRLFIQLRMVLSDKTKTKETSSVHLNNLYRVVQYCENRSECRRAQLLEYFGETGFDRDDCHRNKMTTCDNCSCAGEMDEIDIAQEAKWIVESVNTLIHRGNSNWRRPMAQLTLNHLVDVFKVTCCYYPVILVMQTGCGAYTNCDTRQCCLS